MNRQRRQEAKKKQREREHRAGRRRRFELDRCTALIMEADAVAGLRGDLAEARRLLERALRIHPGSQGAHERLAELAFRSSRHLDGLGHYEQLAPARLAAADLHGGRGRLPGGPVRAGPDAGAGLQSSRARNGGMDGAEGAGPAACRQLQGSRPSCRIAQQPAGSGPTGSRSRRGHERRRPGATGDPRLRTLLVHRAIGERRARRRNDSDGRGHPCGAAGQTARPARRGPSGSPAESVRAGPPPDAGLPPFPIVRLPDIAVQFEADCQSFLSGLESNVGPLADVLLRRDAAALRLQKGFDELISLGSVQGVEHFWYQLETVRRLLRDFRGRLLLADEVGLGKTIEACLALKEYWMRGLVSRALILTPASLVGQWVDELTSKFGLSAHAAERGGVTPDHDAWDRHPIVVASLPLVRQRAYRARLAVIDYDLVIVDEAHVLGNRASAAWQLVNELKKRFLLLLSATPVGNDLSELYNLILLLKPGLLKTEAQFRASFGDVAALAEPARRERLRALLREVMIRNTRAHIDVTLPRRLAATEIVAPTAAEIELQEWLSLYMGNRYGSGARADHWRLMTMQAQAGSSPAALRAALDRRNAGSETDDLGPAREILRRIDRPAKTTALIALLRRSTDKAIVFTRFRATVDHLQQALEEAGFRVATFHGGLAADEKRAAIAEFERDAQVLVSSEVGGEGRNLQFCRTVINYDLPWNPVQLEQRVGRVHRIGQTRDVFVFNLCLAGSLEQHILTVLHEKLNLFELVAGEIEMILGEFDPERDFAEVVMDLWARSSTGEERESAFARFADELMAARERYRKTQEIDRTLFREEFEV